MKTVTLDNTVGELVRLNPRTARAFKDLGIDFCCGGKKSLREVCNSKSLEPDELLEAIRRSVECDPRAVREVDCSPMGLSQLADHIVSTHHAYLENELPRLGEMVEQVARVHGEEHEELTELREVFLAFEDEIRQHMLKEEEVLFPALGHLEASDAPVAFPFGSVSNPIQAMLHEHDSAGDALKRMRKLTNGFTPPPQACDTWRAVLEGLRDLEEDLHWHIHKENNILFPLAVEIEKTLSLT